MAKPTTLRMVSARPTLLDFQAVERGITSRTNSETARSLAFAHYVLESVFQIPYGETELHIVDGGNDRGIDLVYIDEENRQINLGSCKVVTSYKKASHNFPGSEVDKILSFVDDLLYRRDGLLNEVNQRLSLKVRQIWEAVESDQYSISVHLFSNQAPLVDSDRDRLLNSLQEHGIKLHQHSLYELAHGVVRAARPKISKKIMAAFGNCYTYDNGRCRGFHLQVSLKEVYDLVSVTKAGEFDLRLFSSNVRYFLGTDNEVNKEIRATLLAGRSLDFWHLNNGITIVCDQIIGIENGHHKLTLINPQIVNGGQTARVIFDVFSDTLAELADGYVSLKIIETADEALIRDLALASNTQSRIFTRDLRANDHIQIKLANSLATHGYGYVRKRGELIDRSRGKIIDAARAGQILLAFSCGEPTKSKTESSDIFGSLYDLVFDEGRLDTETLISGFECYTIIDRFRSEAELLQRSVLKDSFDETWIIEGHFHVLFVIGEIMRRQRIALGNLEFAINTIPEAMKIVSEYAQRNGKTSYYRLFRLTNSKSIISEMISGRIMPSMDNPVQLSFF